jgi:polar amino acid transport system substrate-binding protein
MSGKVLGVKLGSLGETLRLRIGAAIASARSGAGFREVKTYDGHPAVHLALAQGTGDGVLNTLLTLAFVIKSQPGRFAVVRGVSADTWASIAARKENVAIVAWLDERIKAMTASGRLGTLQENWFNLRFNLPATIPPVA